MARYLGIVFWWITFVCVWGVFRILEVHEFFSEVLAKPFIWLGITFLFLKRGVIPAAVITDLRTKYTTYKPIISVIILPVVGIVFYFFAINSLYREIAAPVFSLYSLVYVLVFSLATGIVEETIYRGILYVWLLRITNEVRSFILAQLFFVVGHLPILILNFDSLHKTVTSIFFILLISSINTIIFRKTRSIFAAILVHGIWNSLVYYFFIL
jgi:membrane protease YdiL (CAAX protease family)